MMSANKTHIILILTVLIIYTRFFSFSEWSSESWSDIVSIISITLVLIYFVNFNLVFEIGDKVNFLCSAIFWASILTSFGQIYDGLPLTNSLGTTMTWSSPLLFFYVFYKRGISLDDINTVISIVGLITFGIQIFQLVNPGMAMFGARNFDNIEIRNGISRFSVGSYFIAIYCCYYYWDKTINSFSKKNALLFCIFAISVYLYLTRQLILAVVIMLVLSFILGNKSKVSNYAVLFIIAIAAVLFIYSNIIFGSLFNSNSEDGSFDVRVLSIPYFWEHSFDTIRYFFIGHGGFLDAGEWHSKGQIISISDIGIVGILYSFGIFTVLCYLYTLYLVFKRRNKIPLYCKMYAFSSIIHCMFIFPYRNPIEGFLWMTMLYAVYTYSCQNEITEDEI